MPPLPECMMGFANNVYEVSNRLGKHIGLIPQDDEEAMILNARRAGADAIDEINEDGKRPHRRDSGEQQRNAKRARRVTQGPDHAARLVQAEGIPIPRNARPIPVPGNTTTVERRGESKDAYGMEGQGFMNPRTSMKPPRLGRTHNFGSTLNCEPNAPTKLRPPTTLAPFEQLSSQRQATSRSNKQSAARGGVVDEIEDSGPEEVWTRARRKVATHVQPDTVIDLRDPDDRSETSTKPSPFDGNSIVGRHHTRHEPVTSSQPKGVASKAKGHRANDLFDTKPFHNMNAHLFMPGRRGSTAPKPKSDPSASQNSFGKARRDVHPQSSPGTKEAPLDLDRSMSQTAEEGSVPSSRPRGDVERPPITLDKGFDTVVTKRTRLRGDRHAQRAEEHEQAVEHQIKPVMSFDWNIPRANSGVRSMEPISLPAVDTSASLRTTFEREDNTAATPVFRERLKAKDRMLVKDEKQPATDLVSPDDSPDVLCGRSNVRVQSKFFPHEVDKTTKSKTATRQSLHASPRNVSPSNQGMTARRRLAEDVEDDGKVRVRLQCINCRSCVICSNKLSLVWDSTSEYILVEYNGAPRRHAHADKFVRFGSAEIQEWKSSPASLRVALKGSQTDDSMSVILIEFADREGKNACYDQLMYITGDQLRTTDIEEARMDGIWRTQVPRVQIDARQADRHAEAQEQALMRAEQSNALRQEDRIKYDGETSPEPVQSHRPRIEQEPVQTMLPGVRRSARTPKRLDSPAPPTLPRWSHTYKGKPWEHAVLYPPDGMRKVTVDFPDIERLDEGEFLNDNLVGYALRRIEEEMAPVTKKDVHFFNSFFFTSLMNKNGKKAFNYDAVKKWVKNKDIFNLPYIVVPINDNLHWYLAVICNLPSLPRKRPGESADDLPAEVQDEDEEGGDEVLLDKDDVIQDSQDPVAAHQANALSIEGLRLNGDSRGSLEGAEHTIDPAMGRVVADDVGEDALGDATTPMRGSKKLNKRSAPPLRKYPTSEPTIVTFDSFGGAHTAEVGRLKDYVNEEAKEKRGMEVPRGALQGLNAKGIPQQTNFCDCGLFLIGYVEAFAADPKGFIDKVLSRTLDHEKDFAGFDPSLKRAQLREDLFKLYEVQHRIKEEAKKQKRADKAKAKAVNSSQVARDDVAPASSSHAFPPAENNTLPLPPCDPTLHHIAATTIPPPAVQPSAEAVSSQVNVATAAESHVDSPSSDDDMSIEEPHGLPTHIGDSRTRQASSQFAHDSHEHSGSDEILDNADELDNQYSYPVPHGHNVDDALLNTLEEVAGGFVPLSHSSSQSAAGVPASAV